MSFFTHLPSRRQQSWFLTPFLGRLPVNKPLQQFSLAADQLVGVGDQIAIVLEIEQHLAVLAKVLHVRLRPAHCELGRPLLGFNHEIETPMLQRDAMNGRDPSMEITPVESGSQHPLHFVRPLR